MKNLENITTVFSVMKGLNVSIEDLVAYSNNHTETENIASPEQEPSSRTRLPLEVLYGDGHRSFFFETSKTPVAIIIGNIGVAFEDAPEEMSWHDAKKYCDKYFVGGLKWSLPNQKYGHLDLLYNNKKSINLVLKAFGKKPLKKYWYWASEGSNYGAWGMGLSDGSVYRTTKYYNYGYVRPVLAL